MSEEQIYKEDKEKLEQIFGRYRVVSPGIITEVCGYIANIRKHYSEAIAVDVDS